MRSSHLTARAEEEQKRTMKRTLIVLFNLAVFLLITPAICSGGQFKITRIYNDNTVKAEGYDRQCLG